MLTVLLTGQFMAAMDASIVTVAASALRDDLGVSGAMLQMVIAGYLLTYAVLLVTGARLGADYGPRRLFIVGLAVFTLASLACGVAPTAAVLIASRVVQGVGAALMAPQVLSMIQRHFEGPARARALGYYSVIMAVGVTAGQVLGGILVTTDLFDLSWRLAFLINVPVGFALLAGTRWLPETAPAARRALDVAGVATLSLAMLLVVIPLTFGREVGWPAWTWLSLAVGGLGLIGFVMLERAVGRAGGSPLLDLETVSPRGVKAGLVVVFVGMAQYGGFLFTVTLHLQSGLGYSALESALNFIAYSGGFGLVNLTWARLPERIQRWTPTGGLLLMAAADVLLGVAVWSGWRLAVDLPLLFVAGSGHGFAFGPLVNQMAARVQGKHASALSGLVTTAVQLAVVVGVATLGSLYLAMAQDGSAVASVHGVSLVASTIAVVAALSVIGSIRLALSPGG
jgi:MFS family permease